MANTRAVFFSGITPDQQTGTGGWTEETFIRRFEAFELNFLCELPIAGLFSNISPHRKFPELFLYPLPEMERFEQFAADSSSRFIENKFNQRLEAALLQFVWQNRRKPILSAIV